MKQTTEAFEELVIPRKDFSISSDMVYKVYKDRHNFEVVEASSALDALARSKIKNVYKIERHNPLERNVISLEQVVKFDFGEDIAVVSEAAEATPVPQTIASNADIQSVPSEPAPLSNDDIDKLLNG